MTDLTKKIHMRKPSGSGMLCNAYMYASSPSVRHTTDPNVVTCNRCKKLLNTWQAGLYSHEKPLHLVNIEDDKVPRKVFKTPEELVSYLKTSLTLTDETIKLVLGNKHFKYRIYTLQPVTITQEITYKYTIQK